MKKTVYSLLAVLAIASMALVSCKKDNEKKDNGGDDNTYTPAITVDGQFSDWDAAEGVVTVTPPEGAQYGNLAFAKVYADPYYVNLYLQFEKIADTMPLDILLNVDGDTTTGGNSWIWTGADDGFDILIESGNIFNGLIPASDQAATTFDFGGADQSAWAWNANANYGSSVSYKLVNSGDTYSLEVGIIRAGLKITGTKLGLGFITYDAAWGTAGVLPQGVADGAFSAVLPTEVTLPALGE